MDTLEWPFEWVPFLGNVEGPLKSNEIIISKNRSFMKKIEGVDESESENENENEIEQEWKIYSKIDVFEFCQLLKQPTSGRERAWIRWNGH